MVPVICDPIWTSAPVWAVTLPVAETVSSKSPRVTVAVSILLAGSSAGCSFAQPHQASPPTTATIAAIDRVRPIRRVRRFAIAAGDDDTDAIVSNLLLSSGRTQEFDAKKRLRLRKLHRKSRFV